MEVHVGLRNAMCSTFGLGQSVEHRPALAFDLLGQSAPRKDCVDLFQGQGRLQPGAKHHVDFRRMERGPTHAAAAQSKAGDVQSLETSHEIVERYPDVYQRTQRHVAADS